ncbi:MAG: ribosomal RNA small subunit methyltransferase A [Candidatus Vogelbacteria bacterium]|nr:ribosomal RNA small subunit methyltransferase A [Candidatus Vogelbacteria bacterium]
MDDQEILNLMIKTGAVKAGDMVLEVGPGEGTLTTNLLNVGAKVVAIEKDARLIPILAKKFEQEIKEGKLELIEGDILDLYYQENLPTTLKTKKHKLIANIPYYLTGELIKLFLQANQRPTLAVLLIQKEVGERVTSYKNKESVLSLAVKLYCKPSYIATVPKILFNPAPKVDSSIILFDNIHPAPKNIEVEHFFKLVKQAFSGKRKKLSNTLTEYNEQLIKCGINPDVRPENVEFEKWLCLARK